MLIVLLALACTDPEPAAVAACQALPGIAVLETDLPLFETLLSAADIAHLRQAEPTRGLQAVDAPTLATMRSQTSCTVEEVNGAGSGRWAVKLSRTAPTVDASGAVGAPDTQQFEWQVIDEDGGRVDLNLVAAGIARKNAEAAIDEEDFKRFSAGWRALSHRWPDPLLTVDVAFAEALETRMDYAAKLQHSFDGAGEGMVQATVQNTGDKAVAAMRVDAVFESADGPLHARADLGAVAPGQALAYQVEIPDGAEGNVRLRTIDLLFAE